MMNLLMNRLSGCIPGTTLLELGCKDESIPSNMISSGIDHVTYVGVGDVYESYKFKIGKFEFIKSLIGFYDPPEKFDIVVMIGVLERMSDPQCAMKSAARAVKKGGEIYVVFNNPVDREKWFLDEFGYSRITLQQKYNVNGKEIWRLIK